MTSYETLVSCKAVHVIVCRPLAGRWYAILLTNTTHFLLFLLILGQENGLQNILDFRTGK